MQILQPGVGAIRSSVYLSATGGNVLWGRLPCAADGPVLSVDAGTEVTVDTISHEGLLEDQGRDPLAWFGARGVEASAVLSDAVAVAGGFAERDAAADGPHVVTGPIEVRGARPGDLLKITVLETLPRVPYGVVSNRHGRGALPGEFPEGEVNVSVFASLSGSGAADDPLVVTQPRRAGADAAAGAGSAAAATVSFPAAPFLGIMGVATAARERPHSVPPASFGGNLDVRLLTEGASVYLPVQVPGALAYFGDPHFAQGDGEVALTAVEASLRVTVRFDIVPAARVAAEFGAVAAAGPLVETPEFWAPTGLDADLDEAAKKAVRAAISLLVARYGFDPAHALAYLSAASDFDISQLVDRVKGVHARIRKADLE